MNSKFGKLKTETKVKSEKFKTGLGSTIPGNSPALNASVISDKISDIIIQEFPMLKNIGLLCDLSTILAVQSFCTVQTGKNELSCKKSDNYRF